MQHKEPTSSGNGNESDRTSDVKCCHCKEWLDRSGWCSNCQRWPINVTPIRYCPRAHRVDPDGFCPECVAYVLSRLEPGNGEWRDTGRVSKLLSREENQRRLRDLMAGIETAQLAKHPKPAPVAEQKKALEEWIREREAEGVPF